MSSSIVAHGMARKSKSSLITNETLSSSRYLQNSVSACFPKDLAVTWTFVNTYFPSEDSLFKLEPSTHRGTCILTKYGMIDVAREEKSETDIPDAAVYLKYLASRLCVLVFKKLDVYSAEEIITEVSCLGRETFNQSSHRSCLYTFAKQKLNRDSNPK